MELYFFRHGDAEPAGATRTDEERQLTETGREDTREIAGALKRAGVRCDRLFSSPFLRARQTSDILAEILLVGVEVTDRLRSGCALEDIQQLLHNQHAKRVLLVGHEPDFSRIIAQLIGGGRVHMSKSGVACVRADHIELGVGTLLWLLAPEAMPARFSL